MREIVLCDIRQAENQEALVVKSSMEKKGSAVWQSARIQELNPFLKKRKKEPEATATNVMFCQTNHCARMAFVFWSVRIEKSLDFQVRDSEIPWRVYSPW